MDEAACVAALAAGWEAVDPAADFLVVGEMGIGNTTSAAAIATALYGGDWVGRGTGVDDDGLARKQAAVDVGVARHTPCAPLDVLARLGGRELAGMAGAIAAARAHSIPVILDGFICTAAAAPLAVCQSDALDHVVAGHLSEEGTARERPVAKLWSSPRRRIGRSTGDWRDERRSRLSFRHGHLCRSRRL